jgi:hypothetical protein
MAKFCEVCKRSYPDDQEYCPHCAGAVEDSGIDLSAPQEGSSSSISSVSAVDWGDLVEEPAAPAPSVPASGDSAIDLGQTPPQSAGPSGASAVGWGDLAAEPPPHTGAHPAPVDSPSDADLRGGAEGEAPSPPKEGAPPASDPKVTALAAGQAKSTILAAAQAKVTSLAAGQAKSTTLATGPEMVQDLLAGEDSSPSGVPAAGPPAGEAAGVHLGESIEESESSVDLGASPPPEVETSGVHLGQRVEEPADRGAEAPAEASGSGVNLAEVGAEAAETPSDQARVEPVSSSGLDLGDAVVVEDVTGEPLPGGPVAADSGINLVGEGAKPPETPVPVGPAAASDSGVLVDRDLARLEQPVTPRPQEAAESPSGRDLIAEAVESGVDLPSPQVEVTEAEGTEVVSLDVPASVQEAQSSSAVDLGSSAEVELPPVSASDLPLEEMGTGSAEAVDLAGLPEPPPAGSGLSGVEVSESSVDLGSHAEVVTPGASGSISGQPV